MYRQDQYPATGNFGDFKGAKWHDLFAFDGTLDEDATDMGMKALTPKAGYDLSPTGISSHVWGHTFPRSFELIVFGVICLSGMY